MDETSLSSGELYTIITNKAAKGRSGSIVAMIQGTRSEYVIDKLLKIPLRLRYLVKEITIDFAANMHKIITHAFPCAKIVNDRFHLHKLAYEAVQEIRIKHRWEAIEKEQYDNIQQLDNGDTLKQLLARSRYLLFKTPEKWSSSQKERATILFNLYPEIKRAYYHAINLNKVFQTRSKEGALTKLAQWYNDVEKSEFKSFRAISKTVKDHYETILNYYDNKATNAAAENFNAKIKAFRASFRGVRDISFFIFRLTKIYA